MRLSFLYPIYNRARLFEPTLASFVSQRDRLARTGEWEILVIDDASTDDIRDVCIHHAQHHKLPIRYIRIEPQSRSLWPVYTIDGANNACIAKNVGLVQARGDYVVFTSPEVMHSSPDNLLHLLDWNLPNDVALIATVTEGDTIISGGPECRALDFLARYHRKAVIEMGGFEEMFVSGWAWEDQEFMERWERNGGRYAFAGDKITAVHQEHPHPGAGLGGWHNHLLYLGMSKAQVKKANVSYPWGDKNHITEMWSHDGV